MSSPRTKLLSVVNLIKLLKASEKPPLVCVDEKDTVRDAIALMDDRDYSQLPVMKDREIVGIVTYEEILRWARMMKWAKVEGLAVSEIMTEIKITDQNVDLIDILDTLAAKSYIVVKMRDGEYEILTSYDALNYFRENAESFLILNDIESHLREIISECFDGEDFRIAAAKCAKKVKTRVPETVDAMTFGEYKIFIISNWEHFSPIFSNKQIFERYIEKCREIRNNTFHFKHVSKADQDFLKNSLNWIIRKIKK